jgi:general secretion pathway protein D
MSGVRRWMASPRSYCASIALALSVAILPTAVSAQTPGQSPPTRADSSSGKSDRPKTPPQVRVEMPDSNDVAVKSSSPTTTQKPAPKDSEDLAVALERPGDLNLHGLTLNAALFTIGEQWNINIVAGDLQGTVNGVFKQAPLREILDAILLSNGYNYRAVGKSLVISSVAELGQVNPFFQSATIPVQNADIDEVTQGAQLLTTPKGQVRALKSVHSIVVLDFPDRVKMIRDFVNTLDTAGNGRFPSAETRNGSALEVGYFRTQNIAAKTAEQAILPVMSKVGKCSVMEKEDRLLVADYPENLSMIEKVLQQIDRPRPQVRIVALMYDISLEDIQELGINWKPSLKGRIDSAGDAQSSLGVDSVTKVPFASDAVGNTLTFMSLSRNFDITTVARCLQNTKDARLLADPNVAVLENEDAVLEKVSEIPYQQLTQTQQGGDIGTTAFKKVGITLHVRPKISVDGVIRMDVKPEVSRLTGFTPGDNQPIVDTSSATTVLSIANRQTVAIGGLRQRQDVGEFTGVPYLKDLSVIGRLFRSRDTDVRESELVVFIMPEIIPYDDMPTCRQQIAAETIHCRLDQIPQAEGCPPCCRRLPVGMFNSCDASLPGPPCPADAPTIQPEDGTSGAPASPGGFYGPDSTPSGDGSNETLPAPTTLELHGPMSAAQIPSAEFEFGVAGRSDAVQALVADGRLRRLPAVIPASTQVAVVRPGKSAVSSAPMNVAPADVRTAAGQPRVADRELTPAGTH